MEISIRPWRVLILVLGVFLSACATKPDIPDSEINDPRVYGRVMTVREIKTFGPLSKYLNFHVRDYGSSSLGSGVGNSTLYLLADERGRDKYHVIENGGPEYKVGDCVSYWMSPDIDNPYYPRLTRTSGGCKLYATDGIWTEDGAPYKYNVTKSVRLKRLLQSWLDRPVADLLKQWGKPTRTFRDENGKTAYVYNTSYEFDTYIGNRYTGRGVDSCDKILHVGSSGMIDSWSWKGNDCDQ